MRKMITLAVAATFAVAIAPMEALGKGGGHATLTPASEMKWNDVEGFPGVKIAALQGDPAKGAHHSMQKLPAGLNAPLHHHSPDHYVTVLTGTLVLTVDGKETRLPPGSYFHFTGKKPHLTRCEAGADCMLFADVRGKWDIVPEGEKPAAKKK